MLVKLAHGTEHRPEGRGRGPAHMNQKSMFGEGVVGTFFFFFFTTFCIFHVFFTRSIYYLHNETGNKGLVLHFNGHPSRPKTVCSIVKFPLLSVKLCPKHDLEIVWQVKPTDDEGIIENRGVWDFFLGGGCFLV